MSQATREMLDKYAALARAAKTRRLEWFESDELARLAKKLGALVLEIAA